VVGVELDGFVGCGVGAAGGALEAVAFHDAPAEFEGEADAGVVGAQELIAGEFAPVVCGDALAGALHAAPARVVGAGGEAAAAAEGHVAGGAAQLAPDVLEVGDEVLGGDVVELQRLEADELVGSLPGAEVFQDRGGVADAVGPVVPLVAGERAALELREAAERVEDLAVGETGAAAAVELELEGVHVCPLAVRRGRAGRRRRTSDTSRRRWPGGALGG
jgi:hypothetical protein